MRERLEAQLHDATAALTAHMATWECAFAVGANSHGAANHPRHRQTRAETERLATRCRELQARLDTLDA
jgi:hypothetical protein